MASKREKERALKDFIQGSFSKKMASKGFGVTAKGELGDTVSDLVADYLADMLLQIEGYLESVDEVVEEAFQAEKQKRVSGAKTKAEKTAANRFNKSSFNKMLGSKAVQAASPELASVLSNASQLKQIQAAIYSGTASPDDYKKLTGLFRKGIGGLGALASKGTTGNAIADTATDAARRRNLERKFTEEQIDRQTKELTKGLNSSLEDYIDKNYNEFNKRFAKESSNSLKLGLMAFLGPASPLVELLDETFDLEEKIEKKTRKFQEKFLQMQNNVANATIQTNESVKGVDSAIAASARAELEYQQEQTKTEKSLMSLFDL